MGHILRCSSFMRTSEEEDVVPVRRERSLFLLDFEEEVLVVEVDAVVRVVGAVGVVW